MKTDSNPQAELAGATFLSVKPRLERALGGPRLALGGLLVMGLLLGGCSGDSSEDSGSNGSEAQTSGTGTDQVAQDNTGGQDSGAAGEQSNGASASQSGGGFGPGGGRLDTGVDLTQLSAPNQAAGGNNTANPNLDANLKPGHLALAEGHSQSHDFGDLHQGDVGSHTFRLKSDGEAPLVITRIKPSCGCTVAEIVLLRAEGEREVYRTGEEISPGTEFEIVAELDTAGKSGAVSTSVAMYSNDPRAVFNLNLKAQVSPMLAVDPSTTIAFDQLTTVDSASSEVTVTSEVLDPFLLSVDERYIEGQPVKVELAAVDPDAEGRSRTWTANVTIGPNFTREGINNFPIVLNTDKLLENVATPNPDGSPSYHQVRIYAQATVLSMVAANPAFLSMGMLRPQEAVTHTVRISSMDPEFTLPSNPVVRMSGYRGTEFQYAEHFETELLPVEGENALDLDLRLLGMPEGFTGSFGGVVVVEVGHPSKPEVEVRFSGVCRAGVSDLRMHNVNTPKESTHAGDAGGSDGHEGHDH